MEHGFPAYMPLYTDNDMKANLKSLDMKSVELNGLVINLQNEGKQCLVVLAELTELQRFGTL